MNSASRHSCQSDQDNSKMSLQELVQFIPDAVFMHRNWEIVFINKAGGMLYGGGRDYEFIGKSVPELIDPELHEIARSRTKIAIIDREIAPRIEQRHVKLDGTHFEVEVQTRSIMMDGEVTALTIVHDIARRKQVEKMLQEIVTLFDYSLNKFFLKN